MEDMSDEEKRAHILGYFKSANSWATGTGTALAKTPITDEGSRGPGKCLSTNPAITASFIHSHEDQIVMRFILHVTGSYGLFGAGWWSFKTDCKAVAGLLLSSWLNILIITAPLGMASQLLKWGPIPTFMLNFCALVPLALLLGEVTEDLAVRFGSTIGGLLNATFGNIVELILSVAALNKGLYIVIAASLAGSILSNLLLVLGMIAGLIMHAHHHEWHCVHLH